MKFLIDFKPVKWTTILKDKERDLHYIRDLNHIFSFASPLIPPLIFLWPRLFVYLNYK